MVVFNFSVRLPLSLKNGQMHPQNRFLHRYYMVYADSSENTAFYEKIVSYENIYHLICDKKSYFHFWRKMNPSKKCSCPPKIVFRHFLGKYCFLRKNCYIKKYSKLHFP